MNRNASTTTVRTCSCQLITWCLQNGGHERGPGLSDHHFLHYWVTVGTTMHILYIRDATMHQVHMVHPHMFSQ